MATNRKQPPKEEPPRRRKPATTLDARENQMISLAVDLAERQLREGTASAQVINHYLRLGTSREKLEQEKLGRENELLRSRTDALESAKRVEELYSTALSAMRSYAGHPLPEIDDDDF